MKPIVLTILDGWGISPTWGGNAIEMYSPQNFNALWRRFPHLILRTFYYGQNGRGMIANSEIGHMMIGAGRDITPDCSMVDQKISTVDFFSNQELLQSINHANKFNSNIHLIGMLSEGCIHSSLRHTIALLRFFKANNFPRVFLHLITDGRDVDEVSANIYLEFLQKEINNLSLGVIASVSGRYYAMDRDGHWDRTRVYFQTITGFRPQQKALDARQALHQAYQKKVTDEFIVPTLIYESNYPAGIVKNNDAVILTNFRSDRMRQLLLSLSGAMTGGIFSQKVHNLRISTLVRYHFSEYDEKNISPIFSENPVDNTLSEVLNQNQIKFLKISETDKLAHVTYFLNCGRDASYENEDREIIKSADVQSFRQDPKMKAREITEAIIRDAKSKRHQLIIANYANVDELAHTGDILSTSKAVEEVDLMLGKLNEAVEKNLITLIVTADHGNAEQMVNDNSPFDPETFHTLNPVPFILADNRLVKKSDAKNRSPLPLDMLTQIAQSRNSLKDIAPTVLDLLNLNKPVEMNGNSLLKILNINKEILNESAN
jgi:2,3-bisphosphoglycerate-independent phosphoglycerate mutase